MKKATAKHYWYKTGRRYFETDLCEFNDFIYITLYDCCTAMSPYSKKPGIAVTVHAIQRGNIERFLSRCKIMVEHNNGGIPPILLDMYMRDTCTRIQKSKAGD
jgi:hypothetical protein